METINLPLPVCTASLGNDLFSNFVYFSRFRRHPGFSATDIATINQHDFHSITQSAICGRLFVADNHKAAVVAVSYLPWESDFFGICMGKLYLLRSDGLAESTLSSLVADTLQCAQKKHGISHFSIEVDIDDYASLNCLLKHGFEIMDLKRSYFTSGIHHTEQLAKGSACVRPYESSDRGAVVAIAEQAHFETRFTRDVHIEPGLASKMYQKWFQRMLDDAGNSFNVIVYQRQGQIVACGGIGEIDFLKYGINKRMRTNSLYASLPTGVGAYGPFLYRLTSEALQTHGLVEATISLNNTSAIRVVEGIRPNRSVTMYSLRKFISSHE